jgi:hypothetical protein
MSVIHIARCRLAPIIHSTTAAMIGAVTADGLLKIAATKQTIAAPHHAGRRLLIARSPQGSR